MFKWVKLAALVFALMMVAAPAMAQGTAAEGDPAVQADAPKAVSEFSGAFGAGLVILGAAYGIGSIGA